MITGIILTQVVELKFTVIYTGFLSGCAQCFTFHLYFPKGTKTHSIRTSTEALVAFITPWLYGGKCVGEVLK